MSRTIKWIGIIAISSLLTSCAIPPSASLRNDFKPLPSAFRGSSDTTSSASLPWRMFFKDSILVGLIEQGLANNFDALAALQRIEMAQAQVLSASGRYLPSVGTVASIGQRRFGKYTMDGVGNYDTNFSGNISKQQKIPEFLPDFYLGLQSSWEIDFWKKLRNQKKAATAQYLASIEGRNWLITSLIAEIAMAYNELLALDLELDFIKETIQLQQNQLTISKVEKEAGRSNELVVKQFEAQVLNAQNLEQEVRQQIILTESRLNLLMGRFPQPILRNTSTFMRSSLLSLQVGIPSQLLANRPDIRQAEQLLQASNTNVEVARSAFYPTVTINLGLGFQSFNPAYLLQPQSIAYNLLGGLTAPLINKRGIRADFKTAQAVQLEALYLYQKTILNAYVEVYNQLATMSNLQQMYRVKNEEAKTLIEAIDIASQLYLTGRASYLEIVLTRQNALKANLELIEIKKRQYDAIIMMYRALGGGWK
ncbi:MAG: efflux transporter outer membrane subunit [Spirosomataceae bacterium]